jgi:hypothetical protein
MTAIVIRPADRTLTLDCPGVVRTNNSLTITSDDAFYLIDWALVTIEESRQWYFGDALLYAEKRGLKSRLEILPANLVRSTIYSWIECARFYPPRDRHPDLTFSHHYAAMYCLGVNAEVEKAKKWLAKAAAGKWTVGELREAIRSDSRRAENDPGPMRGIVWITDFIKISKWTSKVHTQDLSPQQLEEIRQATGPLYDFLCDVHRKSFTVS